MKKLWILFFTMTIFLFNTSFAVILNPVNTVDVKFLSAAEIDSYMASAGDGAVDVALQNDETVIFSSGDSNIILMLSPVVELQLPAGMNDIRNSNIGGFFDDAVVAELVNQQTANLSTDMAIKKQAEIIDIVNQIRSNYRRMNFTNVIDGSSTILIFALNPSSVKSDITAINLDMVSGNLIYGIGSDETGSDETGSYESKHLFIVSNLNDDSGTLPIVPEQTIPTGSSNSGSTGSGGSTPVWNPSEENGVIVTYKDAVDKNLYKNEFQSYDNARSAELKVIEHCLGNDCAVVPENIMPTKDVFFNKVELDTRVKNYNFVLKDYYAQDTEKTADDALQLLTDHNLKEFKKTFENEVINRINITKINENGKEVKDSAATKAARQEAWNSLDNVVEYVRSYYGKIEVVTEGYNPKDFYVCKTYLQDLDNTVFAEDLEGNLLGIKTDEFNDIFHTNDLGDLRINVVNSKEAPLQENKLQYRLSEGNFYLCRNCSVCDENACEGLVACGFDDSELGLYVSKYCADHACCYVWDWEVDPTNDGSTYEGLKCIDRLVDGYSYCAEHRCNYAGCINGIVGISTSDAVAAYNARATGSADRTDYSDYCATHKCMAFKCIDQRIGDDTTPRSDLYGNMISYLYCENHAGHCNVVIDAFGTICNNPVSETAYEAYGRMICETHLSEVKSYGNGINDNPPRIGICSNCGGFLPIYFGGTMCNSCMQQLFYANAQNDLDLQMAILQAKAQRGVQGNGWLNKKSFGLYVDVYDAETGELVHQDASLAMWRAQQSGLYYSKVENGQKYIGYGLNCADSALNILARTFDDANASLTLDNYRGTQLGVSKKYIVVDKTTGEKYELADLESKGSCIVWDNIEGSSSAYNTAVKASGLTNIWTYSSVAAEQISEMNNCIAFNTDGSKNGSSSRHTTYNTGRDVDFSYNGQSFSGKLFMSYGQGAGGDGDTHAPDIVSFVENNGEVYRAVFSVDANGSLYVTKFSSYQGTLNSACAFV